MNHDTVVSFVPASIALLLGACNAPRGTPASTIGAATTAAPSATTPAPSAAIEPTSPIPSPAAPESAPIARARSFDDDPTGAPPAGFTFGRTGSGALGRWVVRAEAGAPSGANVLAQLDADDTDHRFPVAVLNQPSLRDVRVGVRCKMVAGRVDRACGLVTRYRDENNYYVTRANALEDNVRLYAVQSGQRHQLASWSGRVTANAWHEYRFEARGDHLQVFWDGQRVLDHHDATFGDAGRVGLWTKADSVTYFDDLRAEP